MRGRLAAIGNDDGTALVEFFWLGILLLVPITYAILLAFDVQRATFAITEATRSAGRAYVTTPHGGNAAARSHVAGDQTLFDHLGLHLVQDPTGGGTFTCAQASQCTGGTMTVDCADYAACVAQGFATITIAVDVPLPGLGGLGGNAVHVSGSHREVFDTFVDYP